MLSLGDIACRVAACRPAIKRHLEKADYGGGDGLSGLSDRVWILHDNDQAGEGVSRQTISQTSDMLPQPSLGA